jgi:ribosomal protein L37AE/L43A
MDIQAALQELREILAANSNLKNCPQCGAKDWRRQPDDILRCANCGYEGSTWDIEEAYDPSKKRQPKTRPRPKPVEVAAPGPDEEEVLIYCCPRCYEYKVQRAPYNWYRCTNPNCGWKGRKLELDVFYADWGRGNVPTQQTLEQIRQQPCPFCENKTLDTLDYKYVKCYNCIYRGEVSSFLKGKGKGR